MDADPETVSLRLAEVESDAGPGVVLDLGDTHGTAAVIDGDGVTVVNESPTLFRRTALTGPLPTPAEDVTDAAALNELRDLLNVGDDAWPLAVGWLVASMIPSIPHPVLMLGGEQGTGKSTAARLIVGLVDPSPALLRSEPRDPEAWAMAASGSWCVVIDNVSRIPGWWSDATCWRRCTWPGRGTPRWMTPAGRGTFPGATPTPRRGRRFNGSTPRRRDESMTERMNPERTPTTSTC